MAEETSGGVRDLLALYLRAIDTVDDLPCTPLVLRAHGGKPHYLPRTRWLVRYFVIRHVDRNLTLLIRRLSVRAAVGIADDRERRDREALRMFQEALPAQRQHVRVLLVVAAIVVATPYMLTAAGVLAGLANMSSTELRRRADGLVDIFGGAFEVDIGSVNDVLHEVVEGGPLFPCVLALGVAMSAYAVLRPLVPAFRFARMVFNMTGLPPERPRSATARWSRSHAVGVYTCEREVFAECGARRPEEFPFDLAVSALAMVFPLSFCASLAFVAVVEPAFRVAHLCLAVALVLFAAARLRWLQRTRNARAAGLLDPCMPYERGGLRGAAVMMVERPLGWRQLLVVVVYLAVVGFGVCNADTGALEPSWPWILGYVWAFAAMVHWCVSIPWWHRITREMRDLNRAYGLRRSSAGPVLSTLSMTSMLTVVLAPLSAVSVIGLGADLRRAQARAGLSPGRCPPWLLPLGFVVPPLLFAYVQRELNRLGMAEGVVLDPTSDGAAGTLPWLRPSRQRIAQPTGAVFVAGTFRASETSEVLSGPASRGASGRTLQRTSAPLGG